MKKITNHFYFLVIAILFSNFSIAQIDATDDNISIPSFAFGPIGNVLTNDTLDGSIISNPSDVIITYDNSMIPAITIDSSGNILFSGAPSGIYYISYSICRTAIPSECNSAQIMVVITPTVFANDDYVSLYNGESSNNLISNDTIDGMPILAGQVMFTPFSTFPFDITLDPSGILSVGPLTPSGTYYLSYQICSTMGFSSCDVAYVELTVLPKLTINMLGTYNDYNTDGFVNVGDVINYQFTIANPTTSVISNVLVSDATLSVVGIPIPTFAPSAIDNSTFTAVHVLTPADIMLGSVTNNCTVSGIDSFSAVINANASTTTSLGITDAIKMNAFIDSNANNLQDVGEENFTNGEFHYVLNSDGIIHNITDSSGMFTIYETNPSNSYDLSYTINPAFTSAYFPFAVVYSGVHVLTGSGVTTYNFPITEIPFNDLSISLIPYRGPVPGFSYTNIIRYENKGTSTITSGTVTFNHGSNVTINPVAGSTPITNGFTYPFTNLLRHEVRYIYVTVNTPVIPTVSLGDLVTNTASITLPPSDIHSLDNVSSLTQDIRGSYDPNDKMESHGEKILFSTFSPSDYLTYTIRFENTGTGNAINIKVDDVLNSQLDANSIEMIESSAPYTLERTGSNLSWKFNGINLPPSVSSSSPIGKGYIVFKVKPNSGFAVGDIIPNTANIYFDFNPAIITNTFQTEFIETPPTSSSCWQTFALGGGHTLAIKNDGTLWSWGNNLYGQLGDGTLANKNIPVQIGTETNWSFISAGGYLSHAIKTDGTLWAWGSNGQGQLGDGTTVDKNIPTQIGTATNWQYVSNGINHSLAIKTDGTLWAWGNNIYGQLGDNTTIDKTNPIQIGMDNDWQSCDATKNIYSIARKTSGLLYVWGNGNYGELGNGSSLNILVPTLINGNNYTTYYGGGFGQTIALRNSGIIDIWGGNSSGQLGDGTFVDTNIPNMLNSDTDWVFVDAGYYFSLSKKSNGTIWTWGDNYFGQLGNGNNISTNSPSQISADTNWDKIYVGYHHIIASKTDGTFWTWGWNQDGQLGNGTNTNSNIPIQISCAALSVDDIETTESLVIYPNPTNNILNVNSKTRIFSTEIFDINGRLIQSFSHNNNDVILNIENLSKGIYLLKVNTENGSIFEKIIKK